MSIHFLGVTLCVVKFHRSVSRCFVNLIIDFEFEFVSAGRVVFLSFLRIIGGPVVKIVKISSHLFYFFSCSVKELRHCIRRTLV